MKTCPSCGRGYEDDTMMFCLQDGTRLSSSSGPDADATLHLASPPTQPGPTVLEHPASPAQSTTTGGPEQFRAPARQTVAESEAQPARRNSLPWILAIVFVIGLFGVAIAFIATRRSGNDESGMRLTTPVATPSIATSTPDASPQLKETTTSTVDASPQRKEVPTSTPAQHSTPVPQPTKPKPHGPISGGVLNGKAVRLVQPAYPPIARAAHVSGQVRVQVLIDENGNVISASAISGHALLQPSAVAAARASKFTPTTLSGEAVKVSGVIIYNFVEN